MGLCGRLCRWPLPLAAAAIAGDLLLRHNILWVEGEYFQAMGIWARIWLFFWFAWQIVLVAAVANRLWHRRSPATPPV